MISDQLLGLVVRKVFKVGTHLFMIKWGWKALLSNSARVRPETS